MFGDIFGGKMVHDELLPVRNIAFAANRHALIYDYVTLQAQVSPDLHSLLFTKFVPISRKQSLHMKKLVKILQTGA